jgi:hypothetical protein
MSYPFGVRIAAKVAKLRGWWAPNPSAETAKSDCAALRKRSGCFLSSYRTSNHGFHRLRRSQEPNTRGKLAYAQPLHLQVSHRFCRNAPLREGSIPAGTELFPDLIDGMLTQRRGRPVFGLAILGGGNDVKTACILVCHDGEIWAHRIGCKPESAVNTGGTWCRRHDEEGLERSGVPMAFLIALDTSRVVRFLLAQQRYSVMKHAIATWLSAGILISTSWWSFAFERCAKTGDICLCRLSELHPTQAAVGMMEVRIRAEKLRQKMEGRSEDAFLNIWKSTIELNRWSLDPLAYCILQTIIIWLVPYRRSARW